MDWENCLILACLSTYHCTMEVEYSCFLNDTLIKKGRKTCIIYISQPGIYHCVVKVNSNKQTTVQIEIVKQVKEPETSGMEKNVLIEMSDIFLIDKGTYFYLIYCVNVSVTKNFF